MRYPSARDISELHDIITIIIKCTLFFNTGSYQMMVFKSQQRKSHVIQSFLSFSIMKIETVLRILIFQFFKPAEAQSLVRASFEGLPGVNFTNIFTLSFYARRSRKRKKTDDLTVFFMLLGTASVKAVHRTLMKSTPGVNFTNILRAAFSYKGVTHSFSILTVCVCNF